MRVLRWILAGVILLFLTGVPALWLWGGEWMARKAGEWISEEGPLKDSNSRVVVGDMSGTPWRTLVLEDVAYLVESDSGNEVPLVKAARLEIHFNPLRLLKGEFNLGWVEADSLAVNLVPQAEGFVVPLFPEEATTAKASSFHLSVPHFVAHDSYMHLGFPDLPVELESIEGTLSIDYSEDGLSIQPQHLEADVNDSLGRLVITRGRVLLGGAQGTAMDSLGGSWNGGTLALFMEETGPSLSDLRVLATDLEGSVIQALTGFENLDLSFIRSGDVTFHLAGPSGGVSFGGCVTGTWEQIEVKGACFEARQEDDDFIVSISEGGVWGGEVLQARVDVPLDSPEIEIQCSFADIDLEHVLKDLEADPLPGSLSGRVHIMIADRMEPTEGQRIELTLTQGHVLEVPFESLEGTAGGGIESGYNIEDAAVQLAEGSLEATGLVGIDLVDMDVEFWGNLRPLRRLVPIEGLDGEGDMSARILGPPDSLVVSARGFAEHFTALGTTIPRIDFHKIRGPIVEGRQLELGFTISQPFMVAGTSIDTVRGEVIVEQRGMDLTSLHVARGDSTFDVTGSFAWEPVLRAALMTGVARIGSRNFELVKPVVVTYDAGVVSADRLALKTNQGNFTATGSYDTENEWLEVVFDLHDLDPLAVVPKTLMGAVDMTRIDGALSLSGQIPVLDGTASVSIQKFKFNDFQIDSLTTTLSLIGPRVQVDQFSAARGRGKVTASGDVEMAGPLYTVLEREVFGPDIPGEDTHWNLEFKTNDIHLEEWFSFVLPTNRPRGLVTSTLEIGGDSRNPELRFWATANALNVRGFAADHLDARIDFRNGQILVDSLAIWLEDRPVRLSGSFPVGLSFKPFTAQVPETPMDLVLDSRSGSLRNLRITPWIDGADGTFTGHVAIAGTPGDPSFEGELNAQADSVAIHQRSDVLRDAEVWVTFEDKVIHVVAADADLGGGRVTARGTYSPFAKEEDSYSLSLKLDKAVVRESGQYAARVSGRLTVEPKLAEGVVYPFVSGDLKVHRAEYIGVLAAQDVSSPTGNSFLYDVTIDAPSKIIIQTNDVSGELSASIRAVQEPRRLELQGRMEILTGEWYTPTAKFKVKEGSMAWDDPTTILPELDVGLETLSGGYNIELIVTGRADEIEYGFSAYDPDTGEDAGLSTEEIYRQLFLVGSGHLTTATALTTGLPYFLREFEHELLGKTGIVDDLAIDPTYDETGELSYWISVRKFLTPELSLRFGQELSRYFDPNFSLEYRLGRAFFLRGETLRERTLDSSSVTTRYQLDVSARHDY